jgi:hypothetical protein
VLLGGCLEGHREPGGCAENHNKVDKVPEHADYSR